MSTTQTLEAVRFFRTQYPRSDYAHWLKLAHAEAWARESGLSYSWQDDWDIPSHVAEFDCYDEEPSTCEYVTLRDPETDDVLASLGCVDDATDDYRRVVEAELAWEAMPAVIQPTLPLEWSA